jgi:hypothetical protein
MTEMSAVVTHESERERVNRELLELPGELRARLVISDVLFGTAVGVAVAAASAGVFAFFWWLLPTTMSGER